jgi:hypothetical protein
MINNKVFLIVFLVFISSVSAQFNPHDNIDLKNYYNISNGLSADFSGVVNASLFVGNGSQLTSINASNVNSSTFNVNSSVYWVAASSVNVTQLSSVGGVLSIINSWLQGFVEVISYTKAQVYNKSEVYSVNDSYNRSELDEVFYNKSQVYNKSEVYSASEIDVQQLSQNNSIININNSLVGEINGLKSDKLNVSEEGNLNVNSSIYWDNESNQSVLNVNSSSFWDSLDSPANISAGEIINDGTYVLLSGDNITGDLNVGGNVSIVGTLDLNNHNLLGVQNLTVNGDSLFLGNVNITSVGASTINGSVDIQNLSGSVAIHLDGIGSDSSYFLAGNVGIGTTNPAQKLDVAGKLHFSSPSNEWITSNGGIRFDIDTDGSSTDRIFVVSKDNTATELFRVQEDGKVGIGTSSPAYKFDLVGSDGAITMLVGDNVNDATSKEFRMGSRHYTNSEEPLGIFYVDSISGQNNLRIGGGTATMNAVTSLIFYTGATSTTASGSQRMKIDSNGNVGIGLSPVNNVRLSVANAADGIVAKFFGGNDDGWRGTVNVQDSSDYVAFYGYDENDGGSGSYGDTWFGHGTDVTKAVVVDGLSGDVGVGTSSPDAKLSVNGNFSSSVSVTSPVFVINQSANMCIFQNGTSLVIANNLSGVTC